MQHLEFLQGVGPVVVRRTAMLLRITLDQEDAHQKHDQQAHAHRLIGDAQVEPMHDPGEGGEHEDGRGLEADGGPAHGQTLFPRKPVGEDGGAAHETEAVAEDIDQDEDEDVLPQLGHCTPDHTAQSHNGQTDAVNDLDPVSAHTVAEDNAADDGDQPCHGGVTQQYPTLPAPQLGEGGDGDVHAVYDQVAGEHEGEECEEDGEPAPGAEIAPSRLELRGAYLFFHRFCSFSYRSRG